MSGPAPVGDTVTGEELRTSLDSSPFGEGEPRASDDVRSTAGLSDTTLAESSTGSQSNAPTIDPLSSNLPARRSPGRTLPQKALLKFFATGSGSVASGSTGIEPDAAIELDENLASGRAIQAEGCAADPNLTANDWLHRFATGVSAAATGQVEPIHLGHGSSHGSSSRYSGWGLVRKAEDGSFSIALPGSPLILSLIVLHYFLVLGYSLSMLYFQIASNDPNSVEKDMAFIQKFLGGLAHEDATRIVDAISGQRAEDEKKWNAIHDIIKACVKHQTRDLNGTDCDRALSAFSLHSNATYIPFHEGSAALSKRKLAEISETLRQSQVASMSSSTLSQSEIFYWSFLVGLAIVLGATLLVVSGILIFPKLKKIFWFYARVRRRLHKLRSQRDKSDDQDSTEKNEAGLINVSGVETAPDTSVPQKRRSAAARSLNDSWRAALQGDLEVLRMLRNSAENFDVNQQHQKYGPLLSAAARSGNVAIVKQLLDWGAGPNVTGGEFYTPLQAAAHSGDLHTVQLLIEAGAMDESEGGFYVTALNAAAERGSSEMMLLILQSIQYPHNKINTPGGRHGYALVAAAARGQYQSVQILLDYGASVDASDESGTSALHLACIGNHTEIARKILQYNPDKNKVSTVHGSPLHAACQAKSDFLCSLLIDSGASVILEDHLQRTALHIASDNEMEEVVKLILDCDDSRINAQDTNGNTALHYAAIKGNERIISLLLDHKIDVSIGDKFDAQALFRAAGCHHPRAVEVLISRGKADVTAVDCFSQTALHGPSESEDVRVQELLIKAGANVNAKGLRNITPLHEACNMGRLNNVKLLLERSEIDVNPIDHDMTTPLCRSICSTNERHLNECIDESIPLFMLENRDDININLCNGLALQEACRKGMLDIVKLMLDKPGTNVGMKEGKYGSALQAAAIGGSTEVMELLIQYKADVNQRGGEYGSPLAAAAAFGQVAAVKLLLDNGAHADLRGIGRYGSAYASIGRAINDEKMGIYQKDAIISEIRQVLQDADFNAAAELNSQELSHLRDRWLLKTTGWDWHPEGEL